MRLEGWNHIPPGFGATFEISSAPWWLRALVRTPLIDRFAYPALVRRGLGSLRPHPGVAVDPQIRASATRAGWKVEPA